MTPTEQEQLINELEKDVDRLHALYNQYFMGIEKMEPSVPRKNLDRKIHRLRKEQIKNTALRFKLQMQIQKYNTQSTYWNRICREIENGTYKRHVMLAKRRVDARHGMLESRPSSVPPRPRDEKGRDDLEHPGAHEINLDELGLGLDEPFKLDGQITELAKGLMTDLDDPFDVLSAGAPQTPLKPQRVPRKVEKTPPPTPKRPAPPSPSIQQSPGALDAEKLKTIYRRYLAARKKCNESIDGITYNAVAKSIQDKVATSKNTVDFKVVIRGGKAVIKTVKK